MNSGKAVKILNDNCNNDSEEKKRGESDRKKEVRNIVVQFSVFYFFYNIFSNNEFKIKNKYLHIKSARKRKIHISIILYKKTICCVFYRVRI